MARALRHSILYLIAVVAVPAAAIADDCAARCRAKEMQCLQQTKGDTAKCNAITTQCYQSCRKPR